MNPFTLTNIAHATPTHSPLDALQFDAHRSKSLYVSRVRKTQPFVCCDGKTYWIKHYAEQGLAAEVIGGRLAALVGVGPMTRVIRVDPMILPHDDDLNSFGGTLIGSEDIQGPVIVDYNIGSVRRTPCPLGLLGPSLCRYLGIMGYNPRWVNGAEWSLVIAFLTWLGMLDRQVLVRLTDSRLFTIDYGACFGDVSGASAANMGIIMPMLEGVDPQLAKNVAHVREAIERIEAVSDTDIVTAVAGVPDEHGWEGSLRRCAAIGQWLSARRGLLRDAMENWAHS